VTKKDQALPKNGPLNAASFIARVRSGFAAANAFRAWSAELRKKRAALP
jgi:hypothetical protein